MHTILKNTLSFNNGRFFLQYSIEQRIDYSSIFKNHYFDDADVENKTGCKFT